MSELPKSLSMVPICGPPNAVRKHKQRMFKKGENMGVIFWIEVPCRHCQKKISVMSLFTAVWHEFTCSAKHMKVPNMSLVVNNWHKAKACEAV